MAEDKPDYKWYRVTNGETVNFESYTDVHIARHGGNLVVSCGIKGYVLEKIVRRDFDFNAPPRGDIIRLPRWSKISTLWEQQHNQQLPPIDSSDDDDDQLSFHMVVAPPSQPALRELEDRFPVVPMAVRSPKKPQNRRTIVKKSDRFEWEGEEHIICSLKGKVLQTSADFDRMLIAPLNRIPAGNLCCDGEQYDVPVIEREQGTWSRRWTGKYVELYCDKCPVRHRFTAKLNPYR